jgi:hypothetical protein
MDYQVNSLTNVLNLSGSPRSKLQINLQYFDNTSNDTSVIASCRLQVLRENS